MSGSNDREVEDLKSVSCAVLLERVAPPYLLDKKESTRNCLKYRRGKGEIILVTHDGRGWWDPGSATAKGDIFNLVRGYDHGGLCYVFKHKKFGELGRLVLSQFREEEMLMHAEIYKGNEKPESAAAKKKREIFEEVVATVSAAFG